MAAAGCFTMSGMTPSPELGLPLHLQVEGRTCEQVQEAVSLMRTYADEKLVEWREEVAADQRREALALEEMFEDEEGGGEAQPTGRRLSEAIRGFFQRRRKLAAARG
jgi:hypothetical protein